ARTGVGLPGERTGSLRDPASWKPIDLATIGFGQGLSVTALQLASAFGTLANDGVRLAPRIVREVRAADGRPLQQAETREVARAVPADVARRVTRMLEAVVSSDGTAPAARIPGVRVAGKTGTAQKTVPG